MNNDVNVNGNSFLRFALLFHVFESLSSSLYFDFSSLQKKFKFLNTFLFEYKEEFLKYLFIFSKYYKIENIVLPLCNDELYSKLIGNCSINYLKKLNCHH